MLLLLHNIARSAGVYGAVLAVMLCLGLLAGRFQLAGDQLFAFMSWNLLLAVIPFVLSVMMLGVDRLRRLRWVLMPPLLIVWLLFLPNAPYLLTDLIHLKPRSPVPFWYDNAMLGMFGFTGMLLGVRSLAHVHRIVERWLGRILGWVFAAQIALLCGLGIYLGRFLRWNSWDLAQEPGMMLSALAQRLLHPTEHPQTWGVTLVFGGIMLAAHVALRPASQRLMAETLTSAPRAAATMP